jgi:anti-anti-sigma factor
MSEITRPPFGVADDVTEASVDRQGGDRPTTGSLAAAGMAAARGQAARPSRWCRAPSRCRRTSAIVPWPRYCPAPTQRGDGWGRTAAEPGRRPARPVSALRIVAPGLRDASLSGEITWVTNSPLVDTYRLLGKRIGPRAITARRWHDHLLGQKGDRNVDRRRALGRRAPTADIKSDGAEATIILGDELDLRRVDQFLACVRDVLEGHPALIAVDARGVTFMDSSGLAALLHARSMSGHAEVPFRVGDASPMV